MIIAISGKIGSGKDLTAKIIQSLYFLNKKESATLTVEDILNDHNLDLNLSGMTVKKFADTLKDIVCLLIGCTRQELEDADFKNSELPEMWWYYKLIDEPRTIVPRGYYPDPKDNEMCEGRYLVKTTPRLLLQLIGTECGRKIIHPNVWINALMGQYTQDNVYHHAYHKAGTDYGLQTLEYPKWIITDMRFPNEMSAVKERKGITIRINRHFYTYLEQQQAHKWSDRKDDLGNVITVNAENYSKEESYSIFLTEVKKYGLRGHYPNEHESETALDKHFAEFDYTINNNEGIPELIEKVKEILIKEKIIT